VRRHAVSSHKCGQLFVGLSTDEVFFVHAERRNGGDAQMMGPQPIPIDGVLEGLALERRFQIHFSIPPVMK
jgi:hypothetical protein